MDGKRSVLIVSEDPLTASFWAASLEEAGFITSWCGGPNVAARCPRVDGKPCELREAADVAIVDEQPPDELYGGWPERLCTRVPDDGRTVVVEPGTQAEHPSLRHPVSRKVVVSAVENAYWRKHPLVVFGFGGW